MAGLLCILLFLPSVVWSADFCPSRNCTQRRADTFPFCQIMGDPHVISMDRKRNDYQGTCKVIAMVNQNVSQIPDFTVYMKSAIRSGFNSEFVGRRVSSLKYIEVEVYDKVFRLETNGHLLVDGALAPLPYFFPLVEKCVADAPCQVHVHRKGRKGLELTTDFGLAVSYDGRQFAHISPPPDDNLKNHTGGLCGQWNDHPQDDWMMPDGRVTNHENYFGDSWIVQDPEDLHCKGGIEGPACTEAAHDRAEKLCRPLMDRKGTFAPCITHPKAQYLAHNAYESCVYDVCAASGAESIACTAMTSFAKVCMQTLNISDLDWRKDGLCTPSCKAGMHYERAAKFVQPTCNDPELEHAHDDGRKTEMCVCNSPLVYDTVTLRCVDLSECGCRDDHRLLRKVGETWMNHFCNVTYTCHSNHTISTKPHSCQDPRVCGVVKGHHECVCPKHTEERGNKCVDKDECGENPNICGKNAICNNTHNGWTCHCKPGYVKSGKMLCFPKVVIVPPKPKPTLPPPPPIVQNPIEVCAMKLCKRKPADTKPMCTAFGAPHYKTYDGWEHSYHGSCRLIATQNRNDSKLPPFTVYSKALDRHTYSHDLQGKRASFIKYLELRVYGKTYRMDKENVFVENGVKKSLPYMYPPPAKDGTCPEKCDIFAEHLGTKGVQLNTDFGLAASFGGNWAWAISLPQNPELNNTVHGICGNNDGKKGNSLGLPGGHRVDSNDIASWGDSWTVPDPDDLNCRKVKISSEGFCPAKVKEAGDKHCAPLSDIEGPFKLCLADDQVVNMAKLSKSGCEFQQCASGGTEEVACESLSMFAKMCMSMLALPELNWRTPGICSPKCKAGMEFSANASFVQATCENPYVDHSKDTGQRTEACICEPGLVYDTHTQSCMKLQECGCRDHHGVIHKAGDSWVAEGCESILTCGSDHQIKSAPYPSKTQVGCKAPTECRAINGAYDCYCKKGFQHRNGKCVDVDECGKSKTLCGKHGTCVNTAKGYDCECKDGAVKVGHTCLLEKKLLGKDAKH